MGDQTFEPATVTLRAPRIAVLVPDDHWKLHARRAIEALSHVWGGVGGVVLPLDQNNEIPNALLPVLRHYDPDYVTTVGVSPSDSELIAPGAIPLRDDRGRRILAAARRAAWLREHEDHLGIFGIAVPDGVVRRIAAQTSAYVDDMEDPRVQHIHASEIPPKPLASVDARYTVTGTTGDDVIDLALLSVVGSSGRDEDHVAVDLDTTPPWQQWGLLAGTLLGADAAVPNAFTSTCDYLVNVKVGVASRRTPHTLVVGRAAADFALFMLLSRTGGRTGWLPVSPGAGTGLNDIGDAVRQLTAYGSRKLRVTSVSLDEAAAMGLLEQAWDARRLTAPKDSLDAAFAEPSTPPRGPRSYWAVDGMWDQRTSTPVQHLADGSLEMLTRPAVLSPTMLDHKEPWIVEHVLTRRPLLSRPALVGTPLLAAEQSEGETFVRPSGLGIAYESERCDFVASGASPHGRLAAPRLRWPSLQTVLNAVAAASGNAVQPSAPGRRVQIAVGLWPSSGELVDDLLGVGRAILNMFLPAETKNGPYQYGVLRQGVAYTTFAAMSSVANKVGWDALALRSWLDARLTSGAIRRGLLLGCQVCPWVDFYRLPDRRRLRVQAMRISESSCPRAMAAPGGGADMVLRPSPDGHGSPARQR